MKCSEQLSMLLGTTFVYVMRYDCIEYKSCHQADYPERNSWLVRTDSLYLDLTSRQRNTICLAKSFDLQRKMLSGIIITPTNYIIKLFTCKETVICRAMRGAIFLLTQKWYCAAAQWYYIRPPNCPKDNTTREANITAEGNITRRKANITEKALAIASAFSWRRHPESNWGMKVLQTSALPLGYGATLRGCANLS